MSSPTSSPPIASPLPLPLPLEAQASNYSTVLIEDTESEDGKTSGKSHTDSIGESSTSSWPVEETRAASNSEQLKHRRHSSIESKMSCTWSEDKEKVGLGYPTLISVEITLILCWKAVRKPYDYIVSLGGKALRREFLFALNGWLQVDEESCEVIDCVVSMLHNSSLL